LPSTTAMPSDSDSLCRRWLSNSVAAFHVH
jgi:hypothetical protein